MSAPYCDDDPIELDEPWEHQKFATQGGGIAVYQGGQYRWNTPPMDFPEMQRGDIIPEEWGIVPITR